MIGLEALWDKLLLDQSLPTLKPDFCDLFTSVSNSPPHLTSLTSKLFLSALLSEFPESGTAGPVLEHIWTEKHGFTDRLNIGISGFVRTLLELKLGEYFQLELLALPDVVYLEVLKRVIEVMVEFDSCCVLEIFPCVLQAGVMKCKTGLSTYDDLNLILTHLTENIHLLSTETINKTISAIFELFYLYCYTGRGTILSSSSGPCDVIRSMMTSPHTSRIVTSLPPSDTVLEGLHSQTKASCCDFKTQDTVCSGFGALKPVYECSRMFVDSLLCHATCTEAPRKLTVFYSFSKHLLGDQLTRALYSDAHVRFLCEVVESFPDRYHVVIAQTPVYKALNFEPGKAEWGELVEQVERGLSWSGESWDVMMGQFTVTVEKMGDCLRVLPKLGPPQLALLFTTTLQTGNTNIPVSSKCDVIKAVMTSLARRPIRDIATFCRSSYLDLHLTRHSLDQLSSESRLDILGDITTSITRVVNQLGNKGPSDVIRGGVTSSGGAWKEGLYRSLLLHFTLLPGDLVERVVSQGARNKALSGPVATFFKDYLPWCVNPLYSVSEVVFTSLKSELCGLSSAKEARQLDSFLALLAPALTPQATLKLLLLPLLKSSLLHNPTVLLLLLQHHLTRAPAYNFSLFYELVRLWAAPGTAPAALLLLDDEGLLDTLTLQLQAHPKEGYLMLKLITQGWGWKAGLRFSAVMSGPVIKIPRQVGVVDLAGVVECGLIEFTEGRMRGDNGELATSVPLSLLQLAKYSSTGISVKSGAGAPGLVEELFEEMDHVVIRSVREWGNLCSFLSANLQSWDLKIRCDADDVVSNSSLLSTSQEKMICILSSVELDIGEYVGRDVVSFVSLSALAGHQNSLKFYSQLVTSSDSLMTSPECSLRCFVLVCAVLSVHHTMSLETLLMSMMSSVSQIVTSSGSDVISQKVEKAIRLVPEKIRNTLHQRNGNGLDGS